MRTSRDEPPQVAEVTVKGVGCPDRELFPVVGQGPRRGRKYKCAP